jgi:hypothetical protein
MSPCVATNNRRDCSCIFGTVTLLPVNIGYQQDSSFDAAYLFRVPHDRCHLFILHSGAQQAIEKSASASHVSALLKRLGMPAATPAHLYYQTTIEAIE